ncbi:MAG: hypothetical protein SFW09_08115 [Hyphomicrobiaceae bacterium]|nr:hypothetical protein [Hyphomicrobiaceae bacterium]
MSTKVWYDDLVLAELEVIRSRERMQRATFDRICASLSDGKSTADGIELVVVDGPSCNVAYKGHPVFAFEVGGRSILLTPTGGEKLNIADIESAKQVMAKIMALAIGRVDPVGPEPAEA